MSFEKVFYLRQYMLERALKSNLSSFYIKLEADSSQCLYTVDEMFTEFAVRWYKKFRAA